jgi:hypothetical protein
MYDWLWLVNSLNTNRFYSSIQLAAIGITKLTVDYPTVGQVLFSPVTFRLQIAAISYICTL